MDEETAFQVAIAMSKEESKHKAKTTSARERPPVSKKDDFDLAFQLQQEEYANRERESHKFNNGSPSSIPNSQENNQTHKKKPFARLADAFSNAMGQNGRYCEVCQRKLHGLVQIHNDKYYHPECYRQFCHERCTICHRPLPLNGNRLTWCEHPFWKAKFCHSHDQDGTARCASCERLKAIDARWIALDDGREICVNCSKTMILDQRDGQALYQNIVQFYTSMNLVLPSQPPLMLVDRQALNDQTGTDQMHGGTSQTRGMTLAEEYRTVRSGTRRNGHFLGQAFGGYPIEHRECRVTAILVLFGLPKLVTGSILAHETMHAYLKLTNNTSTLSPMVEEGLCQLMAYLWIEKQTPNEPFETKLASFIAHQIREHPSPIYGDGFRTALECFQSCGLLNLINHVKLTGTFPALA